MEGYVEQEEQKAGLKKWRRVYLRVVDNSIETFASEKKAMRRKKRAKWALPITSITALTFWNDADAPLDTSKENQWWFCLGTAEASYRFKADNKQQFDRWVDVLMEVIEGEKDIEKEEVDVRENVNSSSQRKVRQKNYSFLKGSEKEDPDARSIFKNGQQKASNRYNYSLPTGDRDPSEIKASMSETSDFLRRATELLWNGRTLECEEMLLTRTDKSLHAASYHAMVAWFKALITEDSADFKEAISRLSAVETLASQHCHCCTDSSLDLIKGLFVRTKPFAAEMQEAAGCLITAYCQLFAALLQFKMGSYVKGGLNLRRSWKILDECYKLMQEAQQKSDEEGLIDESYAAHILFGIGSFHFVISLVPSSLMWIVQALGFEGDRRTGIELLQKVHESGTAIAPCATLFLLWIQIFFTEDDEAAQAIFDDIMKQFPNGVLFLYLGGQLITRKGKVEEALDIYRRAYEHAKEWRQMQLIFHFEIGECYLMLCRYEEAIEHYNAFLQENKTTSYRCWCVFNLGVCYCMLDKNEEAVLAFRKVSGFVRKHFSFDAYCLRKSREYLKNTNTPMSDTEKHLTNARFARQGRLWESCLEHLEKAFALLKEGDYEDLVQYYYLKGRALHSLGKLDEGEELLQKAIDMKKNVKRETYIIPHAVNDLGELYYGAGQYDKAEEMFKLAKSFSNYDFDKPLGRKINRNMDLLALRK